MLLEIVQVPNDSSWKRKQTSFSNGKLQVLNIEKEA